MKTIALIPARLESQRFPNKLIKKLHGVPIIVRTYLAALDSKLFDQVYVVSGNDEIIDLINNGNLSLPNQKLATKLINTLRLRGILLSTDGPYNNVIKIKPPLVFNKHNVDFVCSEIKYFLIHENKK